MEGQKMTAKFHTVFSKTIFGIPKAQPRARAFARNGKARMYDPGTAEAWKGEIASQTKVLHGENLQGCIQVVMYFFMSRPKSHFLTNGKDLKPASPKRYFTKKPDADNLAKAVLDALTALNVWGDDSQVVILEITKAWSFDHRSGCDLAIRTIAETADED
jgi:Holliday junction resolvase RusA-like endonuclease